MKFSHDYQVRDLPDIALLSGHVLYRITSSSLRGAHALTASAGARGNEASYQHLSTKEPYDTSATQFPLCDTCVCPAPSHLSFSNFLFNQFWSEASPCAARFTRSRKPHKAIHRSKFEDVTSSCRALGTLSLSLLPVQFASLTDSRDGSQLKIQTQ